MADWTTDLRPRLAGLRLEPAREAEIIEELSHHLDDRVRELMHEGLTSADARRRALDELGSSARLNEFQELRQARFVEAAPPGAPPRQLAGDLWQDILYSVRRLRQQPLFTLAAVLTLALGIGANTAIFSLVNATLLQRLPVRDRDRLIYVWNGVGRNVFSYPAYSALRDGNQTLDGLIAWGGIAASLNADGVTDLVSGVIVTGNFFDVLGVTAAQGRVLSTIDDQTPGAHPVAVISHRFWQTRFRSRPDIVGHQILLNGQTFTVVGVTRPEFGGPEVGAWRDLYVPMMMQAIMRPPRAGYSGDMNPDLLKNPRNGWLFAMGRLKPGTRAALASAELGTIATSFIRAVNPPNPPQTANPSNPPQKITVVPVDDGDPNQRRQMRSIAWLLGGVVAAVLLIACANVANLLLSRAVARARELAVRAAIGASRWRLLRQLLTESVVLSIAGGVVGLFLGWSICRLFQAMPPPGNLLPLTIDLVLDRRVLAFSFLLSLVTGLVFGFVPAIRFSRPALVPALKEGLAAGQGRVHWLDLKKLLVMLELALALPLLVVAALFVQSLRAEQAIDPGIATSRLLSAPLNINLLRYTRAQGREFYTRIIERTDAIPGVESASVARIGVLTGGGRILSFLVQGRGGPDVRFRSEGGGNIASDPNSINANVVGSDFFGTLGIALVRGRDFAPTDTADSPPVAIINETASRLHFAGSNPIGQHVSFGGMQGPWVEVVGVARDSKYAALNEASVPVVYLPVSQNHETGMMLYVRASVPPSSLIPSIRREVQQLEPNLPVPEIQTMEQTIETSLYAPRMGATLLTAFAALALLLAAIGVYGVLAFSISQRTREMGIRFALGAEPRSVMSLVLREGMTSAAIGVVLGLALAFIAARSLAGFLYGIPPTDAPTFIGVTVILGLVAVAACLAPARRAGKVNPIVALRIE